MNLMLKIFVIINSIALFSISAFSQDCRPLLNADTVTHSNFIKVTGDEALKGLLSTKPPAGYKSKARVESAYHLMGYFFDSRSGEKVGSVYFTHGTGHRAYGVYKFFLLAPGGLVLASAESEETGFAYNIFDSCSKRVGRMEQSPWDKTRATPVQLQLQSRAYVVSLGEIPEHQSTWFPNTLEKANLWLTDADSTFPIHTTFQGPTRTSGMYFINSATVNKWPSDVPSSVAPMLITYIAYRLGL